MTFSQYFFEYKYLFLLLFVLIIVFIFGAVNAVKARRKHIALYKDEEERITKLKALKDKFLNLDEETIKTAEKEDLLMGVALHYQLLLQKADSTDKLFASFPLVAQYVYTLDIFQSEYVSLSEFFKVNGKPLTCLLAQSFEVIGKNDLALLSKAMEEMYDEDNESTSLDKAKISKLNEKFSQLYSKDDLINSVSEFILDNAKDFI